MNYAVPPGIYAIGELGNSSPVLVSANYKLSFDYLRCELSGLTLWLLVLNINGINVWCAAGKGSFGTDEIARMISVTRFSELVSHRNLILPQLAAPGVAAHEVQRRCGFKVIYGPIRASDIPPFLNAGNKAKAEMRRPCFNLRERLNVTPVELPALFKPTIGLVAFLFLLNLAALLLKSNPLTFLPLLGRTFSDLVPFIIAMMVGTILVPALLPYIPGRSLAWRGWVWVFSGHLVTYCFPFQQHGRCKQLPIF